MEKIASIVAVGFVVLLVLFVFASYTRRRRCSKCRRWYGGRVESVSETGVETINTDRLEYTEDGLQRVRRKRVRGMRHVTYRCRRCGGRWIHSGSFETTRTY